MYTDTNSLTYPPVKATNCSFRAYGSAGIEFGKASNTSKFSGCRFTDVELTDNIRNGFLSYGSGTISNYLLDDIQLVRVSALRNYGDPLFTSNHTGSGVILGVTNNGLIDRCLAAYNGGNDGDTSSGGPGGLWTYQSNAVTIQRSISHHNKRGPNAINDGLGFDIDQLSTNCVLQYNLSYENEGAGYLLCNTTGSTATGHVVRHNISYNDAKRGSGSNLGSISFWGNYGATQVYNNTIVTLNAGVPCVRIPAVATGTMTGVKMWNNLLMHLGGGKTVNSADARAIANIIFQGNLYWDGAGAGISWAGSNYSTLAAWRAAVTGQEVNGGNVGTVASPLLGSVGHIESPAELDSGEIALLGSGSPAVAAGVDANALGATSNTRDFGNETLRASPGTVGAVQAPLLSLNTAQNPNLTQILVATQDGLVDYAVDKGAGAAATYSGSKKAALKALKNASGQPYVNET